VPSCSTGREESVRGELLPLDVPNTLPLTLQEQPYIGPEYIWKISGYTECTASCLGGLQESIVVCVDAEKESPVAPYFCDSSTRLDIEVRACNERPCPPRWNVSDFSECSQSCGGGNQNRTVDCIQEVAHGTKNIIKLPLTECPQPPPRSQQFCNVIDCPVGWSTSDWTKCSKRCGSGRRYRKVRCRQQLSLGQTIDKPERECLGPKPGGEEACNGTHCDKLHLEPRIRAKKDQRFNQLFGGRSVKLKVGGLATVFQGTIIKLRCPVKNFDKADILWGYGSVVLGGGRRSRHRKLSVSRKGVLRIKEVGTDDAGVYTCMAGKARADIEIVVKSKESKKPEENPFNANDQDGLQPNLGENEVLKEIPSDLETSTPSTQDKDKWKWNMYKDEEEYMYWDNNQLPGSSTKSKQMLNQRRHRPRSRGRQKKSHQSGSPLSWVPGSWGPCSEDCNGKQHRELTCMIALTERSASRPVPQSFCASAGLRPPRTSRRCDRACPTWSHSPWTPCRMAECLSTGTGLMTRSVDCIAGGKVVHASLCPVDSRPADSQPCRSKECLGVWVLGEWSQCSKTCGVSSRRRSVSCEWLRGGPAPAEECGANPRPSARMECQAPPCTSDWETLPVIQVGGRDGRETGSPCLDTSKFCPVVKAHELCGSRVYSEQCCKTCSR